MKKLVTMILGVLLFSNILTGQDTIRDLIISEIRFDRQNWIYVELTNMGTATIDLSEFYYSNLRTDSEWIKDGDEVILNSERPLAHRGIHLAGELLPGDSYLLMNVQDVMNNDVGGKPVHSIELLQRADTVIHWPDWGGGDLETRSWPYIPEWEMWGFDSISTTYYVTYNRNDKDAVGLFWISGDTTTVLVDQVFLEIDWNSNPSVFIQGVKTVAGVVDAADNYNLVRKYSIKQGQTNWELAAGETAANSEWMLIPHVDAHNAMARTTEGYHGDYHIDFTPDGTYVLDEVNGTLTVPWGTEKFDSIMQHITIGDGMAWGYFENEHFGDSLSLVCKTDDTLSLYGCGNDLEIEKYAIIVSDPVADMAEVFAKHAINYPDPDDPDYDPLSVAVVGGIPYRITLVDGDMDTITGVQFATKVDTFLLHLEKAPNAGWEIDFAGGETSNEISTGDILRVTAADGTTVKEYFIKVEDYLMAENVELASITWPDKPFAFLEGWNGDTIPGFISTGMSYSIILPAGTTSVPALVAKTEDPNATITTYRAVSLGGGIAERTTTFTVTSENDSTTIDITVLFAVENPYVQMYAGDPFFSKFYHKMYTNAGMMEICNPSGDLADLSNYMIVRSSEINPAGAIMEGSGTDSTTWLNRYNKYVPGYKWKDYDGWSVNPGVLEFDNAVSPLPYVESGDVVVFWRRHADPAKDQHETMDPRYDVMMSTDEQSPGVYANPWNEPLNPDQTIAYPNFPIQGKPTKSNFYLFKILNDSITDGEKGVFDPNDFELVDVFGSPNDAPWSVGGKLIGTGKSDRYHWRIKRLPHIYKGVTTLGEGLDSDWYSDHHGERAEIPTAHKDESIKDLGQHTLDPITEQVSTVASMVYLVDIGFEGDLGIKGVSIGDTVGTLFANLIKGDPEQVLSVLSESDGSPRAGGDPIVEGDTLMVVSANGVNTTKYTVSIAALDGDATLTAVDGSGLVIGITGESGTVGGFDFGVTLRHVRENVVVPPQALLNIIDASGNMVPLQKLNDEGAYVDLVAATEYYFEVVAENGDIILYNLTPQSAASDAYLLSDVYQVAEDPSKLISGVVEGVAVPAFIGNLVPVSGATLKVLSVTGQERTVGVVTHGDKVEVTSQDGTVTVSYAIYLAGYMPSNNALLADLTVDGTTVGGFAAEVSTYQVTLPQGTTILPAVDGVAEDDGATVAATQVINLDGTEAERTATVEVTAEDGTVVTYTILFDVSTGIDQAGLTAPKIYAVGKTIYIKTQTIYKGDRAMVFDITGQMVQIRPLQSELEEIHLDSNQGIYIVRLLSDNAVYTTRVKILE